MCASTSWTARFGISARVRKGDHIHHAHFKQQHTLTSTQAVEDVKWPSDIEPDCKDLQESSSDLPLPCWSGIWRFKRDPPPACRPAQNPRPTVSILLASPGPSWHTCRSQPCRQPLAGYIAFGIADRLWVSIILQHAELPASNCLQQSSTKARNYKPECCRCCPLEE